MCTEYLQVKELVCRAHCYKGLGVYDQIQTKSDPSVDYVLGLPALPSRPVPLFTLGRDPSITPISLEQWWIPTGSATLQVEVEGSLGPRSLKKKKPSKMKLGIIRKLDRIQTLLLNMQR